MTAAAPASSPGLLRAVGRWQILGLSINSVVGSGVYLLPATAFALLGPFSVWGVLLAGLTVSLLVLCYAKAASYFEQQGGSALYARVAFGPFAGFQVAWTIWLTRVATAASLGNGLADALARFWPPAGAGDGRIAVIAGSLLLLTAINIVGVRWAARVSVVLVLGKLLPLLMFVFIGLFHVDWGLAFGGPAPTAALSPRQIGQAALLLLFAFAGFENLSVAAGEYHDPKRNVPFALLAMILVVTGLYAGVQLVAQGALPGLAGSATPLADAAAAFGGEGLALLLTVGAAISILGTWHGTMLLGPRFLHTLAADGYGPGFLARVHPRFRTPAVAIAVQGALALALALTGSFVQLALLSMVTRLLGYISTAASVLVLGRLGDPPGSLRLPGGPLIPIAALVLSLALLLSASLDNLIAVGIAVLVGGLIYRFPRRADLARPRTR